jgi:peptide/nickel transport system permease protein
MYVGRDGRAPAVGGRPSLTGNRGAAEFLAMQRFRFVLYRPIQLVPVLFGISLVTFVLVHALPGDPVRAFLGAKPSQATVERIRAQYGLDRPVVVQYLYFLRNLAKGEIGTSVIYRMPVSRLVGERLDVTALLVAYGVALALLLTVPLAVLATLNQGRWPDHLIRLFSTAGLGFPAFWLGIMLIIVLSVRLGLFPVSGYGEGFVSHLHHLFLPALTIALALSAVLTRNLRASLIGELQADYVSAARAKGIPERWIFRRHVLPNSLIPTVNLLGVNLGWLIGGTVIVESVFAVPGLGELLVTSIFTRDHMVVVGVALTFAVATVLVNFVVDVVTVALDPRIEL